jgi:glucose-1-phosphate adenylyltransferase
MGTVLAVILAGGRGERLSILGEERSKSAIPVAGRYHVIDFILSNCVNSGIHNVVVLTQYQPLSLVKHIGVGAPWGLAAPGRGLHLLQPYLTREESRGWYKGTADAIYQNLQYIEEQGAELVLILCGDHVYKMDYSWMLKFHEERQADATLAVTRVPEADLRQFGTVMLNEEGQVIGFQEKAKQSKSNLVSMGVYLFKRDILQLWLEEDAQLSSSKHDFGRNIFPRWFNRARVLGYDYGGYWRDIGTVQSYWQVNMDMIEMSSGGYLSDAGWPIRTSEAERPPTTISKIANVANSLICNGCVIEGNVEHSVISPGVIVAEGAVVRDSIIMSDGFVGSHSVIDRSILDEGAAVEAGCHLGFGDDLTVNRTEPKAVNTGITIVGRRAKIPPGVRLGRNCIVSPGVTDDDFPTADVQSGITIRPRRRAGA